MQLGTGVGHAAIESRVIGALREQRARFERTFFEFDAADWRAPTRCDAWNAQQVVIHLCGASTACARVLRGGPDESVAPNFDPNTTPRLHVDSRAGESPAVTLDDLRSSTAAMFDAIAFMQRERPDARVRSVWGEPVDWRLFVTHIFWDAWMHERDVLLTVGETPECAAGEDELAVAYGLLVAAVVPHLFGTPYDGELLLTGSGGARCRVVADTEHALIEADTTASGRAEIEGDARTVADALAGRAGELSDVLRGPPERIAPLALLSAWLRGS